MYFICLFLVKNDKYVTEIGQTDMACLWYKLPLTHWRRMTHICVSELSITGSDNGWSPCQHQAITWTNAGILLIRTQGIYFSEILSGIHTFSFTKMHFKMSPAKVQQLYIGLTVSTCHIQNHVYWYYRRPLYWHSYPGKIRSHNQKR